MAKTSKSKPKKSKAAQAREQAKFLRAYRRIHPLIEE